ncbi:MAG: hypothetical protein E7604_04645 [Ruminococcaceae bacterium]|nr:hypothetical protein [Oscillospiraceae bacterium]
MKQTARKSLAMMLGCLLAVSALASCGGTGGTVETAADTTPTDTTVPADTESTRLMPDLPESDFGGYVFRVSHWEHPGWESRACHDIYAEAENGDIINDAVFARNLAVGEKYNFSITLENVAFDELVTRVRNAVSAGEDAYDLVYLRLYEQKNLISGGYFVDFNTIPNIDLTKPWWDSGCVGSMTVSGRLYLAASSINISDENATAGILFNKQEAQNHDMEDPYQLVRDGKWTMDKMKEMYSDVTTDINGDGKMGPDDLWGFLGGTDVASCFYIGGGGTIVSRDADGVLYDSFGTEKNFAIVEKVQGLMTDTDSFYNHHLGTQDVPVTDDNQYRDLFSDGHGLFFWSRMDEVTTLRGMETDFGILPTPKYDESQENYISFVSQHITGLMSIPATASDLSRTGVILEALAAESHYTLTPAYYEVALKSKASRDDESAEMLDIIFSNRVYDPGEYFNFGSICDALITVCQNNSKGMASEYEKRAAAVTKALDKWVDQIESLE